MATVLQGLVWRSRSRAWIQSALALAGTAALLALAGANIVARATWHGVEDGVLWRASPQGVVAFELDPNGTGQRSGIRRGDILLAVDGRPVESPDAVEARLHRATEPASLEYTLLREGRQDVLQVALQPMPRGREALYYVLSSVAVFSLLVGCAVRLRRPRDQATLHFYWLTVAFFGVLAFSFSGRLTTVDWVFYWGDVVAMLVLPPLFLHFALVFPERPGAWVRTPQGRAAVPLFYLPALLLGGARAAVLSRPGRLGPSFIQALETLDRVEFLHLSVGLIGGLVVMLHALRGARSVTTKRQLRWIVWGTTLGAVPFVIGYVLPFAAGFTPWSPVELLALPLAFVPLAFASAVVRYRLMDVEVIIKRAVVYTTAISAIIAIYAVLLQLATQAFIGDGDEHNSIIAVLATLVVVLLAPIVKNTIQTVLDRAYYRDRYDYRRALVGFARDLNSDLDLQRLSARLVQRVMETLVVDRMALMLAPSGATEGEAFRPIRAEGFLQGEPPAVGADSGVGSRLRAGHAVALDDPLTARRFAASEVERWRAAGIHYFVPCVSKEGLIAIMVLGARGSGEPLSSEDMALLAAVAGQVATALENGRLYEQLRLKADEAERLRKFSESIIESLQDGLVVVGLDDRVVRWNPALETLYGVSKQQAVGRALDQLFDHGVLERLTGERGSRAVRNTVYRVPLESRHADGPRKLLVNAATEPLRTPDGGIAGTIMLLEDVTERVQLEEQLRISDKMASVGLLAAGVAHEVNTPLTGISSFTQILLEQSDPDAPETKLLEKIERQTFRAAKIVNGLLNLARPAQIERGPVDLHAVINDVLSLLEHQFRTSRIQVRKDLAASPPVVLAIEHKLQQVLLNLLLNARDAMPKGGWLTVATATRGDGLELVIADTGAGIPSEHLSRIYDPFFTTKPIGKGTGLGLSITYGIVQEHDGTITCESSEGQGTRFLLTFPRAALAKERSS